MTFIDALTALVILALFFFSFSQVFLPAFTAWKKAADEYNNVKTINFISQSFKNECAKPDRNIEDWKKTVSSVKKLESCEITELMHNGKLRALKAVCILSGERYEILALCAP
jgi:hypothetical protein